MLATLLIVSSEGTSLFSSEGTSLFSSEGTSLFSSEGTSLFSSEGTSLFRPGIVLLNKAPLFNNIVNVFEASVCKTRHSQFIWWLMGEISQWLLRH